jgi:tetratricopeptide (TPR) repeat protein
MAHPPHIDAGGSVLVVVRTDSRYDVSDGSLFLPEGTRLIGSWSEDQPGDGSTYAVAVGEITWHFPVGSVTVSPLAEQVQPWVEQERIANASLAEALVLERQEHRAEAQRMYARALIELEASGKTADEVAGVRQKRAFLLRDIGEDQEAMAEFERLARTYEAAAFSPGYGGVDRDYAELAAQAYNALAQTILHHADPGTEEMQSRLRQVTRRLLDIIRHIARRYETKVEVLLTCAEAFQALGDTSEALSLFDQAETLYLQRHLDEASVSQGAMFHLTRLRQAFGVAQRKRKARSRAAGRKKGK